MKTEDTDARWRDQLSEEEYAICRLKGTEQAFTGKYQDCKETGIYNCKCCGKPLFPSSTKYDSGTGWPSFYQTAENTTVATKPDNSMECNALRSCVQVAAAI